MPQSENIDVGYQDGGSWIGEVGEARERTPMTLDAWMPKKTEVAVKNKFQVFQVEAEGDEDEKEIRGDQGRRRRWGSEGDGRQWRCEERVAEEEEGSAEEEVGQ